MTKLEMIANSIVSDIERGALREGDQLPSEEKLAEQHSVSVGTVQKALARPRSPGLSPPTRTRHIRQGQPDGAGRSSLCTVSGSRRP